MRSWGQVDLTTLASAEAIMRWLAQTEIAMERNPRHPDYSGLDISTSAPADAIERARTPKFSKVGH